MTDTLTYTPKFPGPVQGWAVNWSHKMYWRVQASVPWEDLMQEAYLVFLKCQAAYPVLDTPQHFMALYQTAYTRHFTNLAYKDTDGRCVQSENTVHAEGEDARVFESVGELDNDGALAVKLSRAPAEVRMVLQLLLNAPQELLDIALSGWTGKDKRCKAGGSKKICQMLGLPDEHDVLQQVHDYFTD